MCPSFLDSDLIVASPLGFLTVLETRTDSFLRTRRRKASPRCLDFCRHYYCSRTRALRARLDFSLVNSRESSTPVSGLERWLQRGISRGKSNYHTTWAKIFEGESGHASSSPTTLQIAPVIEDAVSMFGREKTLTGR